MATRIVFFTFLLFLTGCSLVPSTKKTDTLPDSTWQTKLHALQDFQLEGKVAVMAKDKRQSSRYHWQNQENGFEMTLLSVIGTEVLNAKSTPQGAAVNYDGDTYQGQNIEELVYRLTQLPLPISHAPRWLKGDAKGLLNPEFDGENRLISAAFYASNGALWQLSYSKFIAQEGLWLPTQLTLRHHNLKIKLSVYQWTL